MVLSLFLMLVLASAAFAWLKLRQSRVLTSLAATDELTGLPNRRSILADAAQSLARPAAPGASLSALMIDVDHFKRINDTHGHAVGDVVLRQLGELLPKALRARDRLGRIGGEEFLVLLPDASLEQSVQVAQRIRELLAARPQPGPVADLSVTVSIGVARAAVGSASIETLLAQADAALYEAKASGRNAVAVIADEAADGVA